MIIELGKEAKTLNGILKILAWGGFNAACVYILTDNLSTGMIVLGITCILIFVTVSYTHLDLQVSVYVLKRIFMWFQVVSMR